MLTFFGDHVNVFSVANAAYLDRVPQYKFTEKHTMQIKLDQALDAKQLKDLFRDALADRN